MGCVYPIQLLVNDDSTRVLEGKWDKDKLVLISFPNKDSFTAEVNCYVKQHSANFSLLTNRLIFAYSLTNEMNIEHGSKTIASVPVGHLAQLQTNNASESHKQDTTVISGQNMIIIELICLPVP